VKELQLLVRKYHDQIQTLKDKNAELSVNQRKRARKNVPKELTVNDDRISLLRRKYRMMVELMVPPQTFFQKPCPSPAPRFDDKDQYRTKVTAEAALITELHSFIADQDLIQMMKSAHFHATVSIKSLSFKLANRTLSSRRLLTLLAAQSSIPSVM
jgi:hypothetical protein